MVVRSMYKITAHNSGDFESRELVNTGIHIITIFLHDHSAMATIVLIWRFRRHGTSHPSLTGCTLGRIISGTDAVSAFCRKFERCSWETMI